MQELPISGLKPESYASFSVKLTFVRARFWSRSDQLYLDQTMWSGRSLTNACLFVCRGV